VTATAPGDVFRLTVTDDDLIPGPAGQAAGGDGQDEGPPPFQVLLTAALARPDPATAPFPALVAAAWTEQLHPRDRLGRFARKPGGATPAGLAGGGLGDTISAALRAESDDWTREALAVAVASHRNGDLWAANRWLRESARRVALVRGPGGRTSPAADERARRYVELAGQAEAAATEQAAGGGEAVRQFTAKAARLVPHLLGGGQEKWDGQITLFTHDEHPGIAGFMSWDGHMQLLDSNAADLNAHLEAAAADPGGKTTISDAYPIDTVLHELIHGVEGGRAEQDAKAWDALDRVGKSTVETFDRLDRDSAAGGAYPIAHRFDEIHRENLEITQDRVDALTQAGILRKADFSDGITDPATGETVYVPLWLLTAKGRGMLPADRYTTTDHSRAYQTPAGADIEEGFTELGSAMHAPDLVRQSGIGGWDTGLIAEGAPDNPEWQARKDDLVGELQRARTELAKAMDGPVPAATYQQAINRLTTAITWVELLDSSGAGDAARELRHLGNPDATRLAGRIDEARARLDATPHARHATLAEYADRMADPARLADGSSWGAYKARTAAAQEWVQAVAAAEGKRNPARRGTPGYRRAVELADEINREGPAGKIPAMARQVLAATGSQRYPGQVEAMIRQHWPEGGTEAFNATRKWLQPGWRPRPHRPVRPAAAADTRPVSVTLTPEGAEADRILVWAWADPPARVRQATAQVDDLARAAAGNVPALRDIQSAGAMLARLADTLHYTPAGPAPAAARWDEAKHPRIPHGQHGGRFTRKPGALPGTPAGGTPAPLREAVENWIEAPWLVPNDAVADALNGHGGNRFATAIARKLQDDPDTAPELYRAMSATPGDPQITAFLRDAETGTITLGPGSFSKRRGYVLQRFSGRTRMDEKIISVLVTVRAGSKGLDIDRVIRSGEGEVISGGQYRVIAKTRPGDFAKTDFPYQTAVDSYQIELEQVADLSASRHSRNDDAP
jgi:hypothetical protein